jgi:hypothetical protein
MGAKLIYSQLHIAATGADPVHDQCPPSNLKKKKNLVGIYKFKKYRYAKVPTLIFFFFFFFKSPSTS